jgi:hypothetical protein
MSFTNATVAKKTAFDLAFSCKCRYFCPTRHARRLTLCTMCLGLDRDRC